MEMAFQNLQLSNDEDLQSYSYRSRDCKPRFPVEYPLLEGEAPLPAEYLCDVSLLAKFITTYRDQITLPTNEFYEQDVECYTNLGLLLCMVKGLPILSIIDIMDRETTVIDLVRWLKAHNFGGSWFDSLETLIVDNAKNNIFYKLKLMAQASKLESSMREVSSLLRQFNGDLASEEAQIVSQRDKSLKSELADVMEKRKALSVARRSLKFCYLV